MLKLHFIFSRTVHTTQHWYTICNTQHIKCANICMKDVKRFVKLLSLYNVISVANGELFSTSVTTASECSVTKMKFDIHTCTICMISGYKCEFSRKSLECKARYGEKVLRISNKVCFYFCLIPTPICFT
jgi:hypothetical protein